MASASVSFNYTSLESWQIFHSILEGGDLERSEKTRIKIIPLINQFLSSQEAFIDTQIRMEELLKNRPIDFEDLTEVERAGCFEKKYQSLVRERFQAAQELGRSSEALVYKTNFNHRKRYLKKGHIDSSSEKQLRHIKKTTKAYLLELRSVDFTPDDFIKVSKQNELFAKRFLRVGSHLQNLSAQIEIFSNSEESLQDRNQALDRYNHISIELQQESSFLLDLAKSSSLPLPLTKLLMLINGELYRAQFDTSPDALDCYNQCTAFEPENPKWASIIEQSEHFSKRFLMVKSHLSDLSAQIGIFTNPEKTREDRNQALDKYNHIATELQQESSFLIHLVKAPSLPLPLTKLLMLINGEFYRARSDTSTDALVCYKECAAQEPQNPKWKSMIGRVHVESRQWEEARRALQSIEDPAHRVELERDFALRQFEDNTFLADLASVGLTRFVIPLIANLHMKTRTDREETLASRYNKLSSVVQLLTQPAIRNYALQRWGIEYPERLQKIIPSPSRVSLGILGLESFKILALKPTFNFISANPVERRYHQTHLEGGLSLGIDALGTSQSVWYTFGSGGISILSAAYLGCSLLSMGGRSYNYFLPEVRYSPDTRFALRTASKVGSFIFPFNLFARNASSAAHFGTRAIVSLQSQALIPKIATVLKKAASWQAQFALVSARALWGFQRERAVSFMEEIEWLCAKNQFQKARAYQKEVFQRSIFTAFGNDYYLFDIQAVIKYGNCLDFFENFASLKTDPASKEKLQQELPKINEALKKLNEFKEYAHHRRNLLFYKVIAFLKTENFDAVKQELQNEKEERKLFGKILFFLINQAEILAKNNYEEAEIYLDNAKDIFPIEDLNEIILEYKRYITNKKIAPDIRAESEREHIENLERSIQSLINKAKTKDSLQLLLQNLTFELLLLYISRENFDQANELLRTSQPEVHSRYLSYLISNVRELVEQEKYDEAQEKLSTASESLNCFGYNPILEEYSKYLSLLRSSIDQNEPDIFQELENSLHRLIGFARADQEIKEVLGNLEFDLLLTYLRSQKFDESNELLAFSSEEIQIKLAHHIMKKAAQYRDNQNERHINRDIRYLIMLNESLEGFTHKELIRKYLNYIAHCNSYPQMEEISQVNERLEKIDDLLGATESEKEFTLLYKILLREKFIINVNLRRIDDLYQLLDQAREVPPLYSQLIDSLIQYLIKSEYSHIGAISAEEATSRMIDREKVALFYLKILKKMQIVYSQPPSLPSLASLIKSINKLLKVLAPISPTLPENLLKRKRDLLIQVAMLEKKKRRFLQAFNACREARSLLPTGRDISETDQRLIYHLNRELKLLEIIVRQEKE